MYRTVTLGQLVSDLGTRYDGSAFWTAEEARLALNEALRLFSLYTQYWKQRWVQPTTIFQIYYWVPEPLTHQVRVEWNQHPLVVTSVQDLDEGKPGWERDRAGDAGVPNRPTLWVPCGLTSFAIWPADPADNNSLTADGVRRTPVLNERDDYVDVGEEDQSALIGYALHTLLFKGPRDQWRASTALYVEFLQACTQHNPRLLQIPRIRAGLGIIWPEDRQKMAIDAARAAKAARQVEVA